MRNFTFTAFLYCRSVFLTCCWIINEIIVNFALHMEKLYLFNPETDLALAANSDSYTPPANIKRLQERYALLPALYAETGSKILVPDNFNISESPNEFVDLVSHKDIEFLYAKDLKDRCFEVNVWGWNKSVRNNLLRSGVNKNCLPTIEWLDKLRELSHRRTTLEFQQRLRRLIPDYDIAIPIEFSDENEAFNWASENIGAYMKAPWSSSGRGIYQSLEPYNLSMKQWIHGIVQRQGSIIGEIGLKRSLDFATEWQISDGKAEFCGYSVFDVGNHGLYNGNIIASKSKFETIILSHTDRWNNEYILILKEIIEQIIAPFYSGPIGIDMLIADDGRINLCVEVNMRMTMGHVALEVWQQTRQEGSIQLEN